MTISDIRLRFAIFCIGMTLGGVQVLILRRALALCGGDEVVFALGLGVWLLIVAAGSWLGGSLAARWRLTPFTLAFYLLGLSIFAVAALPLLYTTALLYGWIPGTLPGAGGLLAALLACTFPVALLGGLAFPLSCRLWCARTQQAISAVYLWEAAGSFVSGTLLALIFAPHFSSQGAGVILGLLSLIAAAGLLFPRLPLWMWLIAAGIGSEALQPIAQRWDLLQLAALHPGMELIDALETPYGLLEITQRQGQIGIYENGLLLAISDDFETAEERAHLSLVQHPAPQQALWIGGSLGGAIAEALRHPSLQRLEVVELNPRIFDFAERFSSPHQNALLDPRISTYAEDGRRYLASVPASSYDLIVLNLPGPRTARLSKFYTVEGFRLMRRALKPGGVLVFSIPSAAEFIGQDLAALLFALYLTARQVFDEVQILPGENAIFVASDSKAQLTLSASQISARLHERGIEPLYWDRYRLQERLAFSRFRELDAALQSAPNLGLNRDSAPLCFYLHQVVWTQQVRSGGAELLKALRGNVKLGAALALSAALIIALTTCFLWRKSRDKIGVSWAVATVGASGLALEVLTLVSYQVRFGSGYRELGLLVGIYMAGLALGAKLSQRIKEQRRAFIIMQILWLVLPAGLILLVALPESVFIATGAGIATFCCYLLTLGLAGGLHFNLATSLLSAEVSQRAGRLYGLDLLGATLGAALVGVVALPLLGVNLTCGGLALLNLAPLLLLQLRLRHK